MGAWLEGDCHRIMLCSEMHLSGLVMLVVIQFSMFAFLNLRYYCFALLSPGSCSMLASMAVRRNAFWKVTVGCSGQQKASIGAFHSLHCCHRRNERQNNWKFFYENIFVTIFFAQVLNRHILKSLVH